jgi:hypothetical protein
MKGLIGLAAGCVLATAAVVMTASPARAQVPPEVTLTFKLTLNGTVPPQNTFLVNWAENGIEMCNPCTGNGHTYTATMAWPKGTAPVTFVFARFSSPSSMTKHTFGRQTVVPTADRTVRAFFTYGTGATVPTPVTGGAPALGVGVALVVAGSGTVLAVRLRRSSSSRCN